MSKNLNRKIPKEGICDDKQLVLFKEDIALLKKMKLLGEDDDIYLFDEAVYRITLNGDNTIIKDLSEVLDDSTTTPAAMENVIQCIFTIIRREGIESGLFELLSNCNDVLINAERWFNQINRMIIGYEPFYEGYVEAIKRLDSENFSLLMDILFDIKEKWPQRYGKNVDLIISKL